VLSARSSERGPGPVQARLLAPNGQPYDPNALSPKFRVEQYQADGTTKVKEFGPFELKAKKGGGGVRRVL
jgi:hypothetical protein